MRSYNKFNNKKVELDGYKFDSLGEAKHYLYTLKPRVELGEITHLELQPKILIDINGKKICNYIADFQYIDPKKKGQNGQNGCLVVEDVKGFKTPTYRLKKKLVEALYPFITIVEIDPKIYARKKL